MIPGKYDMVVYRGGTFESGSLSRTVDDVPLNFAAYDSITLRVKQAWKHVGILDTDTVLLTLSTITGHIVVSEDELSITITIPISEVNALTFESGRYFLDMHIDAVGDTIASTDKLLYGKFTVLGEDDI